MYHRRLSREVVVQEYLLLLNSTPSRIIVSIDRVENIRAIIFLVRVLSLSLRPRGALVSRLHHLKSQ